MPDLSSSDTRSDRVDLRNGHAGTESDERAGRSMVREEQQTNGGGQHPDQRDKLVVKTDQHSSQCPTPTPTPIPQPTDPFPTLEITSSTPVTPKFQQQQAARHTDGARVNVNGAGSLPVSQDVSISSVASNGGELSLSVASDAPESQSLPKTPAPRPSTRTAADATPRARTHSATKRPSHESVRKLSASQMQALTASPESLPIAIVPPQRRPNGSEYPKSAGVVEAAPRITMPATEHLLSAARSPVVGGDKANGQATLNSSAPRTAADFKRPPPSSRTLSTPPTNRRPSSSSASLTTPIGIRRNSFHPVARPAPLNLNALNAAVPKPTKPTGPPKGDRNEQPPPPPSPSPMVPVIPLPPMSLPTHLQLELAGQRPSPLYIYGSQAADAPYESSAVKFERLLNALLLLPYLEQILNFGTLACLDAWLYTFTILPMRFVLALAELVKWWAYLVWKEARWLVGFVWEGTGRLWQRGRRGRSVSQVQHDTSRPASEQGRPQSRASEGGTATQLNGAARHRNTSENGATAFPDLARSNGHGVFHPPKHPMPRPGGYRHRRTKSVPSSLTSYHKADLLQGAVLICSVLAMSNLDASRMYHFIRAQSSMKLYVIYNILEVADRLLSAIGQDILECLFSSETLSRNSSGRSKLLLPFGMFVLALIYNVIHSWCLFYQVITLNVAVNSYSNSLLTLLISNQFVEIKGSVFKKIEKENLFQLTCSDIVERFQIWIILLIIGMRNVVEVGGFTIPGAGGEMDGGATKTGPVHTPSILPASFQVLPSWILSGEVLSPFLVVIGIEMMVDWIKHAYINKFNNVKPTIYNRMLDILCKDYYTNAFATPSLTRRLGLPLLPLSCLFIRASVQVYHMFLATHLPPPIPTSTATTALSVESSSPSSPAMIAALEHLDTLIRNALGRTVYGVPEGSTPGRSFWNFSSDDAIALLTMVVFFFLTWVVLLILKLLLGMVLLRYSRERYAAMKLREHAVAAGKSERENFAQPGKRVGAFGAVEIGDDRRKVLYEDDQEGLKRMRERERKMEESLRNKGEDGLAKVMRYEMVAKRIW
ncbi:DUF747-domain-containing protein [Xylariomycetidae sp. FL2044]|nr:DUF747-domain-containing protein [Xylariomycetidae sp. FL2044]